VLDAPGIDVPTAFLLFLALGLALSFEFVNGFHDTANAVATVIYTHSLKPTQAVVWSGVWNLIGVLTSTGAVAFGIVPLLPVELVINVGSGAGFALNMHTSDQTLDRIRAGAAALEQHLAGSTAAAGALNAPAAAAVDSAHKVLTDYLRHGNLQPTTAPALQTVNRVVIQDLAGVHDFKAVPGEQRRTLRLNIYLLSETLARLIKAKQLPASLDAPASADYQKLLKGLTNFIPTWVKFAVALALGLGTMIGWKRIVVTVGEKIGKAHLTYGQGAAAVANGSGIQKDTVRNVILAWVLTLPVCVALGAMLFAMGLFFVLRVLGVH
jgi:PiT family inorganic phosphate transporter